MAYRVSLVGTRDLWVAVEVSEEVEGKATHKSLMDPLRKLEIVRSLNGSSEEVLNFNGSTELQPLGAP